MTPSALVCFSLYANSKLSVRIITNVISLNRRWTTVQELSRVESSESFAIKAPTGRVWAYLKELKNVGQCIPGCEELRELGPDRLQLKIKIKIGYISKSLVVDVSLVESKEEELLTFKGTSEDARILGSLSFQDSGDETILKYSLSVEAASAMGRTALTLMGKDFVRKQTELFVGCVQKRIISY